MAAPPRERPTVFWYYSRPPPHRHRGRAEGRRAAEGRGWGRDGVFELLARLIQCEAGGEGDTGMAAVASVVMNRVRASTGEYARVGQGSIRKIILQPGQFTCAQETVGGRPNPQNIYNMRPEDVQYSIAQWAMAGNRVIGLGEALWFFNPYSPDCRPNFPSQVGVFTTRIRNHCFYDPTPAYNDT